MRRKTVTGSTLVGLLLSVSILGLVAASALHGVRAIVQSEMVKSTSNHLLNALYVARAEAINQRTTVTVCPSADGISCISDATAADWKHGWVVRTREKILAVNREVKPAIYFTGARLPNAIHYEYTGKATTDLASALSLCVDNAREGRQIKISVTGRPYVHAVSCRTAT